MGPQQRSNARAERHTGPRRAGLAPGLRALAHGRGGGAASPRAGAFRPPLAARGSLSLPLLGFCCRAPSLCGPRVNPISRGEAPVTPGLPHPRSLSPITPRLPGRANGRRGRPHVGEAPASAGPPPQAGPRARARPAPAAAAARPQWRWGAPRASRGRPARAGRAWGPRREGKRPPQPPSALRREQRVEGRRAAGAEPSAATAGGGRLQEGGAAAARPSPPAAAPARVRGRLCAGRVGEGGDEEERNRDVQRLSRRLGVGVRCGWGAIG